MPGWGQSPGKGNGNALQYSCWKNPMNRGAWWATVHGVVKNQRGLSTQEQEYGQSPTRLLCPWDFPSKNNGVGCHFLLQGIFPTNRSNPCLLHLLTLTGIFFTTEPLQKPLDFIYYILFEYLQCTRHSFRMSAQWMLQTKPWLTWSLDSKRRTLIIIRTHRYVSEG